MELKVSTFSSLGRATRIYSYKTQSIHHLMSDNQLRTFLLLEWSDKVMDIKSNVILEDLEIYLSEKIENLRLDIFKDKGSGKTYELYTNFLVTIDKGADKEYIAISVKNSSNLSKKNTIEKLEIERRYWNKRYIKFYIITDKELNREEVNNINWCRETLIDKSVLNKDDLSKELLVFIKKHKDELLNEILDLFDDINNLKVGTSLFIFRYLIAIKKIKVNMKEKINIDKVISNIVEFKGAV